MMVSDIVLGALIAGIFSLLGIIITLSGNFFSDWRNHKRRLERSKSEFILKERIESYKRVHKLLYMIKRGITDFLVGVKTDKGEINELILELNNESFLFPDSKTMDKIKEGSDLFQDLLENTPKVTIIEKEKIKINQQSLNKLINQLGSAKGEILKAMRKELEIK